MREFDCVDCGAVNNPVGNTHCYNCGMPRPISCPHCGLNNSSSNTHCYNCFSDIRNVCVGVKYVQPTMILQQNIVYGYNNHYDDVLIDLDGDGDIDIIID